MRKPSFRTFLAIAAILAIGVPLWAIAKDGTEGSSPIEVPAEDQEAQKLFADNCGTCHALKLAGADGVVGPNLDELLGGSESEERVLAAIQNGVGGAMPAGILQGEAAEQVAAFVDAYAGLARAPVAGEGDEQTEAGGPPGTQGPDEPLTEPGEQPPGGSGE